MFGKLLSRFQDLLRTISSTSLTLTQQLHLDLLSMYPRIHSLELLYT